MKKISLLLICFLALFTFSCSKSFVIYEGTSTEFVDTLYEATTTKNDFVAVDLRSKERYVLGHVRQMQNYDLKKGSMDELLTWLTGMYNKKYTLYIYSEFSLTDEEVKAFKKHYNKIIILIDKEDSFLSTAKEKMIIDTGEYDCHCN